MKRGRTSIKDRKEFIERTRNLIEECAHYNASEFERKTMRLLTESVTALELELNKPKKKAYAINIHALNP